MKKKRTVTEVIIDSIRKHKLGLTLPELVAKTSVNVNTARKVLGELFAFKATKRTCRVTKQQRKAYGFHNQLAGEVPGF